ncbi:MAG TPA: VTT domain-containing protein [Nocardioidaceae bacterium]|nr:VTT domain-containing protein [Nocardioidaceae bacterium]
MEDLLSLLGIGFASALVPLINIEAYLGLRAAVADVDDLWRLGFVAAFGQMAGKVIWYYIGASSLDWGWVKRRVEQPKAQARLLKWRTRTEERPVIAGLLVFVSALTGFPPFAILAVLAGQLRMSLTLFLVIGLAGRWLRFVAVLGGVAWLGRSGLV